MSKSRGFKKLTGVSIGQVDASCVNTVVLWDSTGDNRYFINAEVINDIPVISLKRLKTKKPKKDEGTGSFPNNFKEYD